MLKVGFYRLKNLVGGYLRRFVEDNPLVTVRNNNLSVQMPHGVPVDSVVVELNNFLWNPFLGLAIWNQHNVVVNNG